MCGAVCALCSIHSAVYSVQFAVWTMQCALCSVQCAQAETQNATFSRTYPTDRGPKKVQPCDQWSRETFDGWLKYMPKWTFFVLQKEKNGCDFSYFLEKFANLFRFCPLFLVGDLLDFWVN